MIYAVLLAETATRPVENVLELGSGGGSNASFLKNSFQMTLADLSPEMLEVSRKLNPECEHVEGDMRTLRLGRRFDAVFVHDAIDYMTTEDDLRAVFATIVEHCEPGAGVVIASDHIAETFLPSTSHGGHDGDDGRALRYLEWTYDPDPHDTTITTDYVYVMRDRTGTRVELDQHVTGLFPRDTWLKLLEAAGLKARSFTQGFSGGETSEVFIASYPRTG